MGHLDLSDLSGPFGQSGLSGHSGLSGLSGVSVQSGLSGQSGQSGQLAVGVSVTAVHVRNQVLDLSQVAEGDTIEAHFAIVSQQFENMELDQGCTVSILRASGVCISSSKLHRAF